MIPLLQAQAETLKKQGLYRQRVLTETVEKHNYSSNDYLSLRTEPRVKKSFENGFALHAVGSGASMSVGGYYLAHQKLEQAFSRHLCVDDALLFSSGYAANLGVITLLTRLGCRLFPDKAVHASVYDGMRLASSDYTRFCHNNLDDLAEKMARLPGPHAVFTEGIFSMSGQQPDLTKIVSLCRPSQSVCIVDEAHSFGVIGPRGLGAAAAHNLTQNEVPLRIIPFGKAMGFQGAIVAGQGDWIDGLFQNARSQRYSTALSPALAHALLENLALVIEADEQRNKLAQLIACFKEAVKHSPLRFLNSNSPIQQLQLGCPHQAQRFALALKKQGISCQPMREPTVSKRETGLRIVLTAAHEVEDIGYLFQQLHRIYDAEYSDDR